MSDVGVAIGAGAAIGGVVVTQVANILLEGRREAASYRVNLFARRLEVHQQGFEWTQKLGRVAFLASPDSGSPETLELLEGVQGANRWLDQNILYLDPTSSKKLATLFRLCAKWALGVDDSLGEETRSGPSPRLQAWRAIVQEIETAQTALVEGIGFKHIDKESAAELSEMRETLNGKRRPRP